MSQRTDFDNDKYWHVWLYDEVDMLSNVLKSFAMFKKYYGQHWPKKVTVHEENRLSISFGEDIPIVRENWTLRDAMYNWLFEPNYDPHENAQKPTKFFGDRSPVEDKKGKFFRSRRDKYAR